ncbi:DUF3224 domain-containing protein [Streptomyces profundus]|uniref:DUF3224 domain-containing protein n=1 Tax=Streptomyces profundus TaxID=2867410 RepID=UPI001D16381F|nr:DUF3224 domain-containing protein [Streptomyces sp. MA3_2.13]UED87161.1 DUF3224 domain-containing protein [Streptomyces sp. MA3_2.13]
MSTSPVSLTGEFTHADWAERSLGAEDTETTPRLAHASVRNAFSGGIVAADTRCEYTIAYTDGAAGRFTGLELVVGEVEGRAGSFVLEERGGFDTAGVVECAFTVVPGSGTGALTGLTGSGSFVHRPGMTSTPYGFSYELPTEG